MTLNRVIALIFFFISPNSIALQAYFVTDRPILSAEYRLHFWPKLTQPAARGLSAIADPYVYNLLQASW